MNKGRVERVERHVARLRRDAARLGLPPPDSAEIESLFVETATRAFGHEDGIVRIDWLFDPSVGVEPELTATTRPLGEMPTQWRAIRSSVIHPGPEDRFNTKFVDVDAYAQGRQEMRSAGCDEALLFDAAGNLVEGSHSNVIVVSGSGALTTPDRSLGGVEGLGIQIVCEHRPAIKEGSFGYEDVRAAAEVLAVNAVRGVVSIVELDGMAIGNGQPGPWAKRLRAQIPGR